jgi:biotin carboxyl carrier protein
VEGLDAAAFDLGPGDESTPAGARHDQRRSPEVRPIAPSADDHASGVRRYETSVDGWVFEVAVESQARAILRERAGQGSGRGATRGSDVVKAQIPGRVVRLWVADGDTVEAGQRLLAIEVMKMENEVRAPRAGTVEAIAVGPGSSVELGDELLTVR